MKKVIFFCLALMGLFLFPTKMQALATFCDLEDETGNANRHFMNRVDGNRTPCVGTYTYGQVIESDCDTIVDLSAVPSASDLAVTFTPALATDNAWQYICVLKGASIDNEQPASIDNTFFTIDNLVDNTEYDVYVRTDCGDDEYSDWKKQTFRTACTPIDTFPFYENFDFTEINFPECWFKINTYTDYGVDYPILTDYEPYEGNGDLWFYTDHLVEGAYNIAIMPAIDAGIPVNTLIASFMLKFTTVGTSKPYLLVGVMDNPLDASTFVVADTVRSNMEDTWGEVDVSFAAYAGTGNYIAFKNETGYFEIDNLSVDVIPTCVKPAEVTVTNITTTGATVKWEPRGTESSWEVVVVPHGGDPNTAIPETAYTDSLDITGLTDDAAYQAYVRANCGGNGYSDWASGNFRSACPDYMTIPYSEDFDSYVTGDYPSCWSRLDNYVSWWGEMDFPVLDNAYHASGGFSLKFRSSNSYAIGIMPPADTANNPIRTLTVSFKMLKTATSCGDCEIGVMTDPDDATTFTPVAHILPTDVAELNVWENFDFSLQDYSGTGNHIALRVQSQSTTSANTLYIDDVKIFATPTCISPLDVRILHRTTGSAEIDWTPRNEENAWKMAVVPTGTDPETATSQNVYSHPYTIDGLTENTTYDVFVKSICNDEDLSAWSSVVTFTTYCLPQTVTLPWSETFDSCDFGPEAALPDCWEKFTNYSIAHPYPVDVPAAVDTGKCIEFFASQIYYSYLVSPALDLSQYPAGSLHLTCKTLKSYPTDGRLDIGYMTDPEDLSTFILIKAIYLSDYDEEDVFYLRDAMLPEDFTTPVHIAFVAPAGGPSANTCLDDVVLDFLPECPAPSDLEITNIRGASALVSWHKSPYGAIEYTVKYREIGTDTWMTVAGIMEDHVLLSDLTETTAYEVRVFATCDSNDSDYITTSFTTGCIEGGEVAIGDGTDTGYEIPVNNYYGYTYSQQIFDASEMDGATSIRGIKFHYAHSSPMVRKNNVVIYLAHTTQNTFEIPTDWIPINSATQVYSGDLNCAQQGWNTFMFDTTFAYNGTDNLVLIVDDNSNDYDGNSYKFYTHNAPKKTLFSKNDYDNPDPANPPTDYNVSFADFRCDVSFIGDCSPVITCVAPNVIITTIDDQSATLEWAAGYDETSWEVEYRLSSDTEWTPAGTVFTPPHVLTELLPGSTYEVRMRSLCDPDYSNWVTLCFATECTPIATLPFTENFDVEDNDENFTCCWTRGTNAHADYPYLDSLHSYSTPLSLCFFASSSVYSYATTPRFDNSIQMDSLQVTFKMNATEACHSIEVGIMTDPHDYSTFVPIHNITVSDTGEWREVEAKTNHCSDCGHYVAFRMPQWVNSYVNIDDIAIQYISACPRAENLTVVDIAGDAVTLTWEQEGDVSEWTLQYKRADTSQWTTAIIVDNPFTITELETGTTYEAKIRSNCPDETYSEYTDLIIFTTTGIKDYAPSNAIVLYPNPATACINVKFHNNIKPSKMQLYDIYGRLLQTVKVNDNPTRIDVSGLSDGVYFVRAITNNGIADKSFVKRK